MLKTVKITKKRKFNSYRLIKRGNYASDKRRFIADCDQ